MDGVLSLVTHRRGPALVVTAGAMLASSACLPTEANPLYCDQTASCTDPIRTYCDLAGDYGDHIGRRCIEPPWDAGAQCQQRTIRREPHLVPTAPGPVRIDHQVGWRQPRRYGLPRRLTQGHKPLHHQRQGLFIQHAQVIHQAVAQLAAPAGATGNARDYRYQGGFQGIG